MRVMDISTKSGVTESRLDLAKKITKYIASQKTENQAIMTAHNGAKLELPLTTDSSMIREVIEGITPISRWWWSSLVTPLEMIRLIYGELPHLHVIWITDGEFFDSWSSLSGFLIPPKITFVGVGTQAGGAILEGYDSTWLPIYKSSQWKIVNSIRDDEKLKKVAESIGAKIITKDNDSLEDIEHLIYNESLIKNYNLFYIIWFFLIIIGLMFPRYQYIFLQKNWK